MLDKKIPNKTSEGGYDGLGNSPDKRSKDGFLIPGTGPGVHVDKDGFYRGSVPDPAGAAPDRNKD